MGILVGGGDTRCEIVAGKTVAGFKRFRRIGVGKSEPSMRAAEDGGGDDKRPQAFLNAKSVRTKSGFAISHIHTSFSFSPLHVQA
ncbi:MAG: hypothetical protein AAFO68_04500, partial [Pseudomonadota bacterium]